jgi:hypothetical protein
MTGPEQVHGCAWCATPFPVRNTGGSRQRFCAAPCRRAHDRAARAWVRMAIAVGLLSSADLRNVAPAARALLPMGSNGAPLSREGESPTLTRGEPATNGTGIGGGGHA